MCRIDPDQRETGLKYRVTDYLPVSRDKIQREMNRTVTDTIVNPKMSFVTKVVLRMVPEYITLIMIV